MINENVEHKVLHDARATHDVAAIRFEDYEPSGRPSWVLATITPDPRSGTMTIPGGYIEAETGKIVVPTGAQEAILKEGRWTAVASAPVGVHPASAGYSWYEPLTRKRVLLPEDLYSPFAHGGTILFSPVPGKTDIEQFGAVRAIFPDWAAHVAPAFAYHQANPHLLDPVAQTVSAPLLIQLVPGPNPLLAVVAARSLMSLGLVQPGFLRAELGSGKVELAAALGYLSLVVPGPSGAYPFVDDLLQAINTAGEPTVRALVLGAFAAGLFDGRSTPVPPRVKLVKDRARQRLVAGGVNVDKDAELTYMFDRMGS